MKREKMNHSNLVESMMKPEFYPHKPDTVELIQTQRYLKSFSMIDL